MNKYFKHEIYWQNHETNRRYYFAFIDSNLLLLRINDFPDEPLYTLIDGKYIEDLDDLPSTWIVPGS